MILLLGGTSDGTLIGRRLAEEGFRVLVSKATEVPVQFEPHPNLEERTGPLDEETLRAVIVEREIRAIVDATHPYAATIRNLAGRLAGETGIPYLSFVRPPTIPADMRGVEIAPDHPAAAQAAFRHGQMVLLTTGTRNLTPYVEQSRRSGVPFVARVLDRPESLDACRRAGVAAEEILACRGPFSVEENRRHLRQFRAGVLVTKDSGAAGGTPEKLAAAQAEGCRVIIVARPPLADAQVFSDVGSLLSFCRALLAV